MAIASGWERSARAASVATTTRAPHPSDDLQMSQLGIVRVDANHQNARGTEPMAEHDGEMDEVMDPMNGLIY